MAKTRVAGKADSKPLAVKNGARKLKNDGWINPDTGFGTSRDKGASGFYCRTRTLSFKERESLYHFDAVAGRIVDERVNEMFRRMFKVSVKTGPEQEEQLRQRARALEAPDAIKECKRLARLHGGAGLVMFDRDTDSLKTPMQPLDRPIGKPPEIAALLALSSEELRATEYYSYQAALSELQPLNVIGTPRMFQANTVNGDTFLVHASRVIQFNGAYATRQIRRANGGWGLSVLERPYEALRAFTQAFQATGGLMLDLSQAVFKMKGLWDMIVGGKIKEIETRMAAVDKARSSIRAIVIDAEEDFERVATPLTGVADLVDRHMMLLSAAIDMPLSRLFGRAPAGLNATGESETRDWYDGIASEQQEDVRPRVEALYARLGGPLKIPMADIEVEFPPLYEPTPAEKATIEKTQAETDHLRIEDGVIDPLEARQHLAGRSYDALIDVDQAAAELVQMQKQSRQPVQPLAAE